MLQHSPSRCRWVKQWAAVMRYPLVFEPFTTWLYSTLHKDDTRWQFHSASKPWTTWRRQVDMTIQMLPLCLTYLHLSTGCFSCLAFRISSLKSVISFIIFTCRSSYSCDKLIVSMDFNIFQEIVVIFMSVICIL